MKQEARAGPPPILTKSWYEGIVSRAATDTNPEVAIPRTEEMLRVCRGHVLPAGTRAVVPEPYVPLFPDRWNGVLVLAEAQNLGGRNSTYREMLLGMSPEDRMARLGRGVYDDEIGGVHPWTDKTLRFAVEAALGVASDECAVSNAVPWSQMNTEGNNTNPSGELVKKAIPFWQELLPVIAPSMVLACGRVARRVLEGISPRGDAPWEVRFLCHPSTQATAPLVPLYADEVVERDFPEVARLAAVRTEWLRLYRRNKIAYACHAIEAVRVRRRK